MQDAGLDEEEEDSKTQASKGSEGMQSSQKSASHMAVWVRSERSVVYLQTMRFIVIDQMAGTSLNFRAPKFV